MPWVSSRELNLLYSEIERLRSIADRERERADRAVDNLMMVHGSLPVGEVAVEKQNSKEKKLEEAIAGLAELLPEETAHLQPNGQGEIPPEPVISD